MSESIALEIIGGPMDGAYSPLTGNRMGMGRGVGNHVTIPLDMRVSRLHAEVAAEGHTWCIRDLNSKGGTWLDGQRLPVGSECRVTISPGQIIFLGSTIVEVRKDLDDNFNLKAVKAFDDQCFINPREQYPLSEGMKKVFERAYEQSEALGFCDTGVLFEALMHENKALREKAAEISAAAGWKMLGKWIERVYPAKPTYQLEPGAVLLAPRVRKIMQSISLKKSGNIDVKDTLMEILKEKNSIPGRYLSRHPDVNGLFDKQPLELRCRESEKKPEPSRKSDTTSSKSLSKEAASSSRDSVWKGSVQRFEEIILATLRDAVSPSASNGTFHLPGFEKKIKDISDDSEQDRSLTDDYLAALEKALATIMIAHRGGIIRFEKIVLKRIKKALAEAERSLSGKKGATPEHLQRINEHVFSALNSMELEELRNNIIRESIIEMLDGRV